MIGGMRGMAMTWNSAVKGGAALALLLAGLSLSACVSEDQAVDMGLATKCDSKAEVKRLGDTNGRYVVTERIEICKGPKKDIRSVNSLKITNCESGAVFSTTTKRISADTNRWGPDIDLLDVAGAQKLRLKIGLTDLDGLVDAFASAGAYDAGVVASAAGNECKDTVAPAT